MSTSRHAFIDTSLNKGWNYHSCTFDPSVKPQLTLAPTLSCTLWDSAPSETFSSLVQTLKTRWSMNPAGLLSWRSATSRFLKLYVASSASAAGSASLFGLCCLTYCWSTAERWAGWCCSMEAVQEVSIVSPLTSSPWAMVRDGSLE